MFLETNLTAQTTQYAMGTVMAHKAFGTHAESCLAAVQREVSRIERLLSRFLSDSDITRVNESAGMQSEMVSSETYGVVSKAIDFSRRCPGCFDITIEPVVHLWKQAKESLTPPDESEVWQALTLVDYRDVMLNPWEMSIGLKNFGQAIDLGGIGKGYTGDQILKIYRTYGITSAYGNLGGNVVTLGTKPDGSPWSIGIQHPRKENHLIGAVSVVDKSVVTAGDDQRYFTDLQGKRHHHILDPRTGYPAESGLISVTVIDEQSEIADALSTTLFVAGMEKGLDLLKSYPGTEAILVGSDLQIYVTQGLRHRFTAGEGIAVTFLD